MKPPPPPPPLRRGSVLETRSLDLSVSRVDLPDTCEGDGGRDLESLQRCARDANDEALQRLEQRGRRARRPRALVGEHQRVRPRRRHLQPPQKTYHI